MAYEAVKHSSSSIFTEYIYDKNGLLIKEIDGNTIYLRTYDSHNNVVKEVSSNGKNEYTTIYDNLYNSNNQLVEVRKIHNDKTNYIDKYEYHENGVIKEKQELYFNSTTNDFELDYYVKYDEHSNYIESYMALIQPDCVSYHVNEYSDDGKLIKTTHYNTNSSFENPNYITEYDENGRVIKEFNREYYYREFYDANGNLKELYQCYLKDGVEKIEKTTKYRYDEI